MKPKAKERPRSRQVGGKTITYTPKATAEAEAVIAEAWAQKCPRVEKPTPVDVFIWIEKDAVEIVVEPKLFSDRPKGVRGDIDNYTKTVLDGLNATAFDDDVQVEGLYVQFRGGQ